LPPEKLYYEFKDKEGNIILTTTKNKIGSILWLKLRKFKYDAIIFCEDEKTKQYFIKRLRLRYYDLANQPQSF